MNLIIFVKIILFSILDKDGKHYKYHLLLYINIKKFFNINC